MVVGSKTKNSDTAPPSTKAKAPSRSTDHRRTGSLGDNVDWPCGQSIDTGTLALPIEKHDLGCFVLFCLLSTVPSLMPCIDSGKQSTQVCAANIYTMCPKPRRLDVLDLFTSPRSYVVLALPPPPSSRTCLFRPNARTHARCLMSRNSPTTVHAGAIGMRRAFDYWEPFRSKA